MKLEVAFVCEDCGLRVPHPTLLETTGYQHSCTFDFGSDASKCGPAEAYLGWVPIPKAFQGSTSSRCDACHAKWLEKMHPVWAAQDVARKEAERQIVLATRQDTQALVQQLHLLHEKAYDQTFTRRRLEALIDVLEATR